NGTIENFTELRDGLDSRGHTLTSETDTEAVAHLIEECYDGVLAVAVRSVCKQLDGSFVLVVSQRDQPDLVVGARRNLPLGGRLDAAGRLRLDELSISDEDIRGFDQVVVLACGSAYHSGLVGKYAIERWTRLPTQTEIASEFRYRDPVVDRNTLVIAVSQSD